MHSFFAKLAKTIGFGIAVATVCAVAAKADDDGRGHRDRDLDRVFVIVMENHLFDEEIGQLPYITSLATKYGLETWYYGVTHPSLPNYLAMVGGDFFGVSSDSDSCFNTTIPNESGCIQIDQQSLVDQLEQQHISWEGLMESMPSIGYLGNCFPDCTNKLYAQKHNPFVYFKDVATDPRRLKKIRPFVLSDLETELQSPSHAARFIYIVPNQCNDQHATASCPTDAEAQQAGDTFLSNTVPAIVNSPAFTENSALFIVWDENDFSNGFSCCADAPGGGHVPAFVITKNGRPIQRATPTNHYSLLATIEDGFDLPRLRNAQGAETLFGVFPDAGH